MARTAVVAGPATPVSHRVSPRPAERWQRQDYEAAGSQGGWAQAAPAAQAPPPAAAPPSDQGGVSDQIERLAALRAQGVLSDDEFAAAKARLLGL